MTIAGGPGDAHPGYELLDRLIALVDGGTTDLADDIARIPLDHYRAPERHEAELDTIFRRGTLCAGPSAAVAEPGDFMVREVLDKSLLITRDRDGVAHVLLNYCTHRGAIIAEGEGCTQRHTCPYHAWSFDASGTLVGLPGAEGFDTLDRSTVGLVELPSEERAGFIFYTFDLDATPDAAAHLGPFAAELERWNFAGYWKVATMDLEFNANWKSTMEAFAETYHFPYVHGASIGPGVIGNTATFDTFGRHHRLGAALVRMREVAAGDLEFDPFWHTSMLYWCCPDLMIANSPFGAEIIQVTPMVDPGWSRLRHTYVTMGPPSSEEELEVAQVMSRPAADAIRLEDGPVLQTCGPGLAHGEHGFATIGRNEPGVQNIHRQVDDLLGLRSPS